MLKRLDVSGYRLLNGFTADFADLTVVIGANASGKSTLLDCLEVISESAEFPISDVLDRHRGIASICSADGRRTPIDWKLTFGKPSRPEMWAGMPLDGEQDYMYQVGLDHDLYGLPILLCEVLSYAQPRPGYTEPFKFLESREGRSKIFDPKQRRLIDFDSAPVHGSQEGVVAERPDGESNLDTLSSTVPPSLLLLPRMRFVHEYPVPSLIRLLLSRWAFYPGFEVTSRSPLRLVPADIKPETHLLGSGENLGMVLHEVLTRHAYSRSARELEDFLRSAYPSFEGINAETSYGSPPKVLVRVREAGLDRAMELWELSDGFLRFLCLAMALLNPAPFPFVAMDEPETGLHPRLLPIVADMIKTASERTQVLITTHSPYLLNCFDIGDIAVMSREESRAKWHRPGSRQSLRRLLENVGGDTLADLHRSGELEAME